MAGRVRRCSPDHRRLFDPERYCVLLFDQRGCGRSTPACLARHQHDLAPGRRHRAAAQLAGRRAMAGVRRLLGLDAGAGLCARRIRRRCRELVVRGIFTLRRAELRWYYQEGASWLFPDLWEGFLAPIPAGRARRPDGRLPPAAGRQRPRRAAEPAPAPGACGKARPSRCCPIRLAAPSFGDDDFALAFARIENHYFVHGGWLEEGQLIRDADKLAGIPGVIVQGRYDMACPAKHRLGAPPRLAGGGIPPDRRCRPCLQRARHPDAADRRDRPVRALSAP